MWVFAFAYLDENSKQGKDYKINMDHTRFQFTWISHTHQLNKTTYPHTKSNTLHNHRNLNPINVVCGILLVYMRISLLAMFEYLLKSNPTFIWNQPYIISPKTSSLFTQICPYFTSKTFKWFNMCSAYGM